MAKKIIKFKKGDEATMDTFDSILLNLPTNSKFNGSKDRREDGKDFFIKNCKITIEYCDVLLGVKE